MNTRQAKAICKAHNINAKRIKFYTHGGKLHLEMAEIPADLIKRNLESGERYRNIPEIDRLIRRYNRQAERFIKLSGIAFCGYMTGTGEWQYREGDFTGAERLASMNMD